MQESSRTAGVDHEPRGDADRPIVSMSFENGAVPFMTEALEASRVHVDDAFGLRLLDQRVVEIRPVPMRVRNAVVRARGDQELTGVIPILAERLTEPMKKET